MEGWTQGPEVGDGTWLELEIYNDESNLTSPSRRFDTRTWNREVTAAISNVHCPSVTFDSPIYA